MTNIVFLFHDNQPQNGVFTNDYSRKGVTTIGEAREYTIFMKNPETTHESKFKIKIRKENKFKLNDEYKTEKFLYLYINCIF